MLVLTSKKMPNSVSGMLRPMLGDASTFTVAACCPPSPSAARAATDRAAQRMMVTMSAQQDAMAAVPCPPAGRLASSSSYACVVYVYMQELADAVDLVLFNFVASCCMHACPRSMPACNALPLSQLHFCLLCYLLPLHFENNQASIQQYIFYLKKNTVYILPKRKRFNICVTRTKTTI